MDEIYTGSKLLSKEKAAVVVSVMWAIWSNWNKYAHEEIKYQPAKSMQIIQELIVAVDVSEQAALVQNWVRPRWTPPEMGWTKINADGDTAVQQGLAGTGVIVRDDQGSVLAGRLTKYESIRDPLVIETSACRDALALALEKGFLKVIIETDY